ncbi:hypothetical protein BGZ73_003341 [Actinomortierella ambigua]|nr:hypothetical protein BGZ73_003341 [Actinomortierella ambigua]
MVPATAADLPSSEPAPFMDTSPRISNRVIKVMAPGARRPNTLVLSRSIPMIDTMSAPTTPLPIPKEVLHACSPPISPPPIPGKQYNHSEQSPTQLPFSRSLRPPPRPSTAQTTKSPRPKSVVTLLQLSQPPTEDLPPIPSDASPRQSSPLSPTSPATPTHSLHHNLLTRTTRASSVGRYHTATRFQKTAKPSDLSKLPLFSVMGNLEEPARVKKEDSPTTVSQAVEMHSSADAQVAESSSHAHNASKAQEVEVPERPKGLVATRYYGIESSMRWREGIDPIEKRFVASNGSFRCQDRFAVFFRPGSPIGPDQVVTKTFWSEAWPYPIETILYGTMVTYEDLLPGLSLRAEQDRETRMRSLSLPPITESYPPDMQKQYPHQHQYQQLKSVSSFPPGAKSRDPRYITSKGVQKIAKIIVPMPDVAIDQMDLVRVPIRVELRIFVVENPLRIHATANLLGRTVTGITELYI